MPCLPKTAKTSWFQFCAQVVGRFGATDGCSVIPNSWLNEEVSDGDDNDDDDDVAPAPAPAHRSDQACIIHDLCYSTIGANRTICDRWLLTHISHAVVKAFFEWRRSRQLRWLLRVSICTVKNPPSIVKVVNLCSFLLKILLQPLSTRQLRENVNRIHFLHKDGWERNHQLMLNGAHIVTYIVNLVSCTTVALDCGSKNLSIQIPS